MPQLGETVAEGTIIGWHKSVGDAVAAGEVLFDIETDKTTMEVPSTEAGVLAEIRVGAGVTVPVGSVVAVLNGAAARDQPAAALASASAQAPAASGTPARAFDPFNAVRTPERNFGPARTVNGVQVTPLARRLAVQTGVSLTELTGSGPLGRITARDVRTPEPSASGAGAPIKALFAGVAFVEVPLDGMRRAIARRLTDAAQRIPHFYLSSDVAVDALLALRQEMNRENGQGIKLSINDFIIKAVALALQRVPQANVVWGEDCLLQFKHSDVAVAVAVENGLWTPLIRQAEIKSLLAIAREMRTLIARARSGDLKPADYQGGSCSISNLGMYDVRSFSAIINPPQSAILAVGSAERRAVEGENGAPRFASLMSVTLSCDHRVIDGRLGAQFLADFKLLLQSPRLLMA